MQWLPARGRALALSLALAVAAAWLPALGGESIYLQSGEEYHGTLTRIADGKAHATVGGEEREFPLADVQRIEFQRKRLLDEAQKATDLPDRIPMFVEALRPATQDLMQRFPQAGYVVLWDETVATLAAGGAWEVKRFQAWRILQQRGARSAMRSLKYFPDRQELEVIFGLTVGPDGAVAHIADSAMKDEALHARLAAYNFQHRLRFNLKNAVPGATLFLATAHRGRASGHEPFVLDRVFWGSEPALRRSVRLAAPPALEGRVATVATNGLKRVAPGLWRVENAPQVLPEPMMPPLRAFAPRLVLTWPKATWAEVARRFRERAGGSPALETSGVPPEALFDEVRTQVRVERVGLDALPDGPAPPAPVLGRRYGNETERARLLAALLRGAGREATAVLVRPRSAGPLERGAASVHGLSRAVVRLETPKGALWLHPDDANRGYRELDPDVQGAHGLDLATGRVVLVPTRPTDLEGTRRQVHVALAPDGSAMVRDTLVCRGDVAKDYRQLKSLTAAEIEKWAARYVGSEVTGVDLEGFTHSVFARANPQEQLVFTYHVPALADQAGKFLLLRLPNASEPATDVGRSTRERALFWKGTERDDVAFTVVAPPGYKVYALGESVKASGTGWSVEAGFAADPAKPRAVTFRDVWERSALRAEQSAYQAYRAARLARSRLRNEVIVFVKE